MTEKEYFVTHSAGCVICDSISRELEDGHYEELTYQDIVDKLNENQKLRNLLYNSESTVIYEYSSNITEDMEQLEKVIKGPIDEIEKFIGE